MANLGLWSWDIYNTADAHTAFFSFPGGATISAANPRTGIQCLQITGAFGPQFSVNNKQTLIFGTAINPNVFDLNFNGSIVIFQDGGVNQIRLGISPTGALEVHRGNDPFPALVGASAPGIMTTGVYQYVEIAVTISTTVGSIEVRLNGSPVAGLVLSNINTQASANAYANIIQFMSVGGGGAWLHDDSYLNDDSGSDNNSFEGAITVYAIRPIADGASTTWVPSVVGPNFDCVDEIPANTADFVASDSVGALDQYLYDTGVIPSGQLVKCVRHSMFGALDSAGSHSVASNLDGVDGDAGTALTTSYAYLQTSYDTKNGTPWTVANLATAEIGPHLVS